MAVAVYILRRLSGVFEAVSSIAWAGLELSAALTPPPPKCWDYGYHPPLSV